MNGLILWLAQGFGVGRIPFAPGTFGSLVGFGWFLCLLATNNLWLFLGGIVLSIPLSAWICGRAEKILQQEDPGSVVLDEIIAIPVCFVSWIFSLKLYPDVSYFVSGENAVLTILVLIAFRVFDIAKPWPVGKSQSLPGGWGVITDDLLAAVYVNALPPLYFLLRS